MKSLYQLERPHQFKRVVGQDRTRDTLLKKLHTNSIGHALMFDGKRGTGKTTIGRLVSMGVNCENPGPDGEPCCECASCKAIINGTSPDVIELDAASNNGVDYIRQIIEQADYAPVGKVKVFIIDECHMLSTAASNALLKTLEEPPANVLFILCTTDPDKVIATIRSRCLEYKMNSIGNREIVGEVKRVCEKYHKQIADDAAAMIANHSGGAMRDALSILEVFFTEDTITTEMVAERLGESDADSLFDVLDGVATSNGSNAVQAVQTILSSGKAPEAIVRSLLKAINDTESIMNGAKPESVTNTAQYKKRMEALAGTADVRALNALSSGLKEVLKYSTSTNADIYLETVLKGAVEEESRVTLLESEVEKLSRKVSELETRSAASIPAEPAVEVSESEVSEVKAEEAPVKEPTETEASVEEEPVAQVAKESEEQPVEAEEAEQAAFEPASDDAWERDLANMPFDDDDLSGFSFDEQAEGFEPAPEPQIVIPEEPSAPEETSNIVSFPEQKVTPEVKPAPAPAAPAPTPTPTPAPAPAPAKAEKPAEAKKPKRINGLEVGTISAADFFAETVKTPEQDEAPAESDESDDDDMPPFGFSSLFGDETVANTVWKAVGNTQERDNLLKAAKRAGNA